MDKPIESTEGAVQALVYDNNHLFYELIPD